MIISLVIVQYYNKKKMKINRKQKILKKKIPKQIIKRSKKKHKQRKIKILKKNQKEKNGIRTGKL